MSAAFSRQPLRAQSEFVSVTKEIDNKLRELSPVLDQIAPMVTQISRWLHDHSGSSQETTTADLKHIKALLQRYDTTLCLLMGLLPKMNAIEEQLTRAKTATPTHFTPRSQKQIKQAAGYQDHLRQHEAAYEALMQILPDEFDGADVTRLRQGVQSVDGGREKTGGQTLIQKLIDEVDTLKHQVAVMTLQNMHQLSPFIDDAARQNSLPNTEQEKVQSGQGPSTVSVPAGRP